MTNRNRSSVPVRENLLRFRNLLFGACETEFQFSGVAGHLDDDGIEARVLHSAAELFLGFAGAMFLEAIGHG